MLTLTIPVLNRYDLLKVCVESALSGIFVPDRILIIDNGSKCDMKPDNIIHIVSPGRNLGVSASWNLAIKEGNFPLLVANDDIEFSEHTMSDFLRACESGIGDFYWASSIPQLNMFSCFMLTESLVKSVGVFDEEFYPAYFEDNDYFRRISLAGKKIVPVQTSIGHIGSATFKNFSNEQVMKHHGTFNKNKNYYISKWGGLPGEEKFSLPFGDTQ